MLARLLAAGLTFLVPAALARLLLPEAYGTFKQGWLLASTLQLILPMGAAASLYYFVPREPARGNLYISPALLCHLASGLLGASLLRAARPRVAAHFENAELTAHLPLIALSAFFLVVGGPFDIAYTSIGRLKTAALIRGASEVGRGLAMVLGASWTGSVTGLFVGIAVATGLRALACWVLLVRRWGLGFSWEHWRRQLGYALPFGLAFLAIIPQQQFHLYAVGAAVPAAAFALYSVGCFQLPVVDVLYTPVSEILQLGLAEKDDPVHGLGLFHEAVSRLSLAFIPVVALMLIVARELIVFFFTGMYAEAANIFRISLLAVVLSALPLDGVMRARAQNRFMLVVSVAKLPLTVGFVLGGLWRFGPVGAMAGWMTAEAAGRMALLVRAATLFRAPLRRILPLRDMGRQAAAAALAAPLAWFALRLPVPAFFRLALAGLGFGAVYVGVLWVRRWLPGEWLRRRSAAPVADATTPET